MEEPKKKSCGCGRAAGIGCAVVCAIVVLSVALIAMNLDAIKESDWYRSIGETAEAAKLEFTYMLQLREELLLVYPAQEVRVNIRSNMGSQGKNKSLVVEFVNPDFDVPDDDTEQFAREIAVAVATKYPEIERFDFVVIAFMKQTGAGVTITTTRNFPFPTGELGIPRRDVSTPEDV